MDSQQHYFRSTEEMFAVFLNHHAAVNRTVEIAERIEPDILPLRSLRPLRLNNEDLTAKNTRDAKDDFLPISRYPTNRHPVFPLPTYKTADELLRELCLAGMTRRYADSPLADEAKRRLDSELTAIEEYANYFLFIGDVIACIFRPPIRMPYTTRYAVSISPSTTDSQLLP